MKHFEILEKLAAKSEKVGVHLLERVVGGRDGYGILRLGWPEEGSKVKKMHWVALMVEMRLTRLQFPDAGLEVRHICHKKLCINPMHLTI